MPPGLASRSAAPVPRGVGAHRAAAAEPAERPLPAKREETPGRRSVTTASAT